MLRSNVGQQVGQRRRRVFDSLRPQCNHHRTLAVWAARAAAFVMSVDRTQRPSSFLVPVCFQVKIRHSDKSPPRITCPARLGIGSMRTWWRRRNNYSFEAGARFPIFCSMALISSNSTWQRIPPGRAPFPFGNSRRTPNVPLAASITLSTTLTDAG